jgi:hypothetical protein
LEIHLLELKTCSDALELVLKTADPELVKRLIQPQVWSVSSDQSRARLSCNPWKRLSI